MKIKNSFMKWLSNSNSKIDISSFDIKSIEHSKTFDNKNIYENLEATRKRNKSSSNIEHEIYVRIHKWSFTSGLTILKKVYKLLAIILCASIIISLLLTVFSLPPIGQANNIINNEVSNRYIVNGPIETGSVNMVTGMILDYRAFDTFGESTVLFVAACVVIYLLKLNECKNNIVSKAWIEAEYDDRHHEPKNDNILQFSANILVPLIILFGLYVTINGHNSPGGGFSGGAIIGASLILYLNAFGFKKSEDFFTYKTYKVITISALLVYALIKSYSFYTGANEIESIVKPGIIGNIISAGMILPLNLCVCMIVMSTMYVFYTLFRKGGI